MISEKKTKSFGEDKEFLIIYSKENSKQKMDYFVYGHRHLPMIFSLKSKRKTKEIH